MRPRPFFVGLKRRNVYGANAGGLVADSDCRAGFSLLIGLPERCHSRSV